MTSLNAIAAAEHISDLRWTAKRHRDNAQSEMPEAQSPATLSIRIARPDEADQVHRLAELDDAPDLAEPVLLALIDGEAVAALSRAERRVVANPFVRTEDAVALLQLRASHLWGGRRRRRSRTIFRPRFA